MIITNPNSYSTPYGTPLVVGVPGGGQISDGNNLGGFDVVSTE